MKAQFKYAFLQNLDQRAYALGATVLICVVFSILSATGMANEAVMTIGVVMESLMLCGVFAVCIIADVQGFNSIFGSPQGYLNILTPVPSWKLLLPRLVTCVLEDLFSLAVAITSLVFQVMVFDSEFGDVFHMGFRGMTSHDMQMAALFVGMAILGYAYILMLAVFGASLKSSLFSSIRFGSLLTLLCVAGAAWALNLFSFVLAPFGMVDVWNSVFTISLNINSSLHIAMFDIVSLLKVAALLVTSSFLIERRINL
jgi:hypothetical protein